MKSLLATAVLAILTTNAVTAADAHIHGIAKMDVSAIDGVLSLALNAPSESFWGFEHQAKTDAQKQAQDTALAQLRSAKWLSLPAAAGCELREATAVIATHTDEAKHEHHNDHEAKHEHHADHETKQIDHSDVDTALSFTCKNPTALVGMKFAVSLFSVFPNLKQIKVQAIGPSEQSAQTLTAQDTTITLPR